MGRIESESLVSASLKTMTIREKLIDVLETLNFLSNEHLYVYDFPVDEALQIIQDILLIDINRPSSVEHATLLYVAVEKGYTDLVSILIKAGADVNIPRFDGVTPLCIAAELGYTSIVKLLLNDNADVNFASVDHYSPLFMATKNNHNEVMVLLLGRGADVNIAVGDNYLTPLMIAAANGNHAAIGLLLEQKAEVNKVSYRNETALYLAAENGHSRIVEELLKNDAYVTINTIDGESPFSIAIQHSHYEVAELIKSRLDELLAKVTPRSETAVKQFKTHPSAASLLNDAHVNRSVRGNFSYPSFLLSSSDSTSSVSMPGSTGISDIFSPPSTERSVVLPFPLKFEHVSAARSSSFVQDEPEEISAAAAAAAPNVLTTYVDAPVEKPSSSNWESLSATSCVKQYDISHTTQVSPRLFIKKNAEPKPDSHPIFKAFTHHVFYRKMEVLPSLIKSAPTILTAKLFKTSDSLELTALQYAMWALDIKLWDLLIPLMPSAISAKQFLDMPKDAEGAHIHFDYDSVAKIYEKFFTCHSRASAITPELVVDALREIDVELNLAKSNLPNHFLRDYPQFDPSSALSRTRILSTDIQTQNGIHECVDIMLSDFKFFTHLITTAKEKISAFESQMLGSIALKDWADVSASNIRQSR